MILLVRDNKYSLFEACLGAHMVESFGMGNFVILGATVTAPPAVSSFGIQLNVKLPVCPKFLHVCYEYLFHYCALIALSTNLALLRKGDVILSAWLFEGKLVMDDNKGDYELTNIIYCNVFGFHVSLD